MNKIALYLNEHLLGEVAGSKAMRRRYSRDASVLSVTPEIVVFPRVTNDIRKVARFTWQLAEKGHPMGMTARGLGGDQTGAAVGKGVVISMSAYMNKLIHISPKDRLAHVQPGITFDNLNAALKWQALTIPNAPRGLGSSTVGGAIANNSLGTAGEVSKAIEKLEVVLANGDLIEVGKLSKHDLSKKLGLQTFEGEIYRKLEGLIEDNEALIKQLAADPVRDNAGYKGIASVKDGGTFDLTPLLIGSQGTLGIISEVVLKTDFFSQDRMYIAIVAGSGELARDIADRIKELEPTVLETIDGALFRRASKLGSQFAMLGSADQIGAVVYVELNDFSERAQAHKLKKIRKLVTKLGVGMVDSTDHDSEEFEAIAGITESLQRAELDDEVAMALINGAYVPTERREEFVAALQELAHKHHLDLPLRTNILTSTFDTYTSLKLDVVSDKQKLFKLLNDYADVVHKFGGAFVSDGAEGRLKANAAWSVLEENEVALYEQVRAIFDPFSTLNPGVKQKNDLRTLVSALRTSYDVTDFVA